MRAHRSNPSAGGANTVQPVPPPHVEVQGPVGRSQPGTAVRRRSGVEMGTLVNTLRVMARPLADGTLPEYLAPVTRDRPEPC